MIEVELQDGTKRKLWCTFGTQQIDLDPFSPSGQSPLSPAEKAVFRWKESYAGRYHGYLGHAAKVLQVWQPCREGRMVWQGQSNSVAGVNGEVHAGSKFVEESLRSLCARGARLLRLDAFGYVTKKYGTKCFFEVCALPRILTAQLEEGRPSKQCTGLMQQSLLMASSFQSSELPPAAQLPLL